MVDKKIQSKQIYIFKNMQYPILKIGMSDNPLKRMKSVQGAAGFELEFYFESEPVINPATIERLIHKELKDYRTGGEWFDIDAEEALKIVKKIVSDSEKGEYKDIVEPYQLESKCAELLDYDIFKQTYPSPKPLIEVEPFIFEDKNYFYYIVYRQGKLTRTAKFCNKSIAIKFKKDNLQRLFRPE